MKLYFKAKHLRTQKGKDDLKAVFVYLSQNGDIDFATGRHDKPQEEVVFGGTETTYNQFGKPRVQPVWIRDKDWEYIYQTYKQKQENKNGRLLFAYRFDDKIFDKMVDTMCKDAKDDHVIFMIDVDLCDVYCTYGETDMCPKSLRESDMCFYQYKHHSRDYLSQSLAKMDFGTDRFNGGKMREFDCYFKTDKKSKFGLRELENSLAHLLFKHAHDQTPEKFDMWMDFIENNVRELDIKLNKNSTTGWPNVQIFSDAKKIKKFFNDGFTKSDTYKKFIKLVIQEMANDKIEYQKLCKPIIQARKEREDQILKNINLEKLREDYKNDFVEHYTKIMARRNKLNADDTTDKNQDETNNTQDESIETIK